MQVLEKSNFNLEIDTLYFVGDLFDGFGKDADKCLIELLKIKNLKCCMGNHDLWVKLWLEKNEKNKTWLKSGGNYTVEKLLNLPDFAVHLTTYFQKVKPWYNHNNYFICHAGFDNKKSVINQKEINFSINRSLFQKAIVSSSQKRLLKFNFNNMDFTFEKVIIGHTPTISGKPEFVSNVINIDTGSANLGKLTLMNLNTLEYYQSDLTKKLYKI